MEGYSSSTIALLLGIAMLVGVSQQESIDEIIAGSYENPDGFDLLFDKSGQTILTEMDMLIKKEDAENLGILERSPGPNLADDPNAAGAREKRKAVRRGSARWTSKTIPYKIASGVFTGSQQAQIKAAINEWQTYTCLRFKEASRSDNNRIFFNNGRGCYSYVGMTGGSQEIGLAYGCRVKGVIVHEIGHAVGFHHEQNRPDRDNHVRILRQNIMANLYYNFKKYPSSAVDTMGVPYDFGSIMHYGSKAFSNNGRLTIQTIDSRNQGKIGNRQGLSFYDIKLANLMYKCSEKCGSVSCPAHGFVAKDCKCYCPGSPLRECSGTGGGGGKTNPTRTPKSTTTSPITCRDRNRNCPGWAKSSRGYCESNEYVKTYCIKSCGRCATSCADKNSNCPNWAKLGYCKKEFVSYMSKNCAKTCDTCMPMGDESQGGTDGAASAVWSFRLASIATLIGLISSVFGRFI